jgi:DNA mismatch repair protein MutL
MDPEQIDVNVHPTKTEIKFEEERLIYNYLKVAVKHALGQYNVTPAIDFDVDYNFTQGRVLKDRQPMQSGTHHSYSPMQDEIKRDNQREWRSLYDGLLQSDGDPVVVESKWSQGHLVDEEKQASNEKKQPYQIHNTFIINQIKSGFLLIDQNAAHERILYEKYLKSIENQGLPTQKQLFPENILLNNAQAETMDKILPKINKLGFDITSLGQSTYVIYGEPVGIEMTGSGKVLVEKLLHQFENNLEFQLGINENLARSMAVSTAIKKGTPLSIEEMDVLIDQLFACSVPYSSPSGRKCFISMEIEDLKKRFTIQ